MRIPNPFFKDIPTAGDLAVEQVLEEYQVLLLFVCTDENNRRYLCTCYNIHGRQEWFVAPITTGTLIDLLQDKITIHEALSSTDKDTFHVTLDYETRKETGTILKHGSPELGKMLQRLEKLDEPIGTTPATDYQQIDLTEYLDTLRKEGSQT